MKLVPDSIIDWRGARNKKTHHIRGRATRRTAWIPSPNRRMDSACSGRNLEALDVPM